MAKSFKIIKGLIRRHISMKDREHNDQKFENTKEVIKSRNSKDRWRKDQKKQDKNINNNRMNIGIFFDDFLFFSGRGNMTCNERKSFQSFTVLFISLTLSFSLGTTITYLSVLQTNIWDLN